MATPPVAHRVQLADETSLSMAHAQLGERCPLRWRLTAQKARLCMTSSLPAPRASPPDERQAEVAG